MKRCLFTIVTVLSLILCIGSATMWVRSGFALDRMQHQHDSGRSSTLISGDGLVSLTVEDSDMPGPGDLPGRWHTEASSAQDGANRVWMWPAYRSIAGVQTVRTGTRIQGYRCVVRHLGLPYWLLTLSAGILPGFWCWRRRKAKRRQKAGLCPNCGYDLRASPQRCPECGTAAPVHSPRAGNTT